MTHGDDRDRAEDGVAATRVWLVIGASTGIGRAVAETILSRAGDKLVATARDRTRLADLAASDPARVELCEVDVVSSATVRDAISRTIERFGSVDVVVSCAGNCLIGSVEESSDEEIRAVVETNFFGVVNVVKAVVPYFRERRSGHLAVVTSNGAFDARPGCGAYCASKAGANGILEAVAAEVGSLGIGVTIIEPGLVRTDLRARGTVSARQSIADYDLTCAAMRASIGSDYPDSAGDPQLAGRAIVQALVSADPPRHLPLGSDALSRIRQKLAALGAELDRWQDLALSVTAG
ncbi:MAG TPA: SDR family NAD(P)-dependent oxidoreductase [Mycobacteriales bacterium]|jgi:NAD(P)-dependent dehydrogenase (short-subunit alcohol dehydrogenase family)|nr:SDR family NAD(P)-dependent oxidoreductase [Mycobacteriales bacterium]